jgi:hypothetical protein
MEEKSVKEKVEKTTSFLKSMAALTQAVVTLAKVWVPIVTVLVATGMGYLSYGLDETDKQSRHNGKASEVSYRVLAEQINAMKLDIAYLKGRLDTPKTAAMTRSLTNATFLVGLDASSDRLPHDLNTLMQKETP